MYLIFLFSFTSVTEPDEIFFNSAAPEQKPLQSVDQFGPEVTFRYEVP